MRSLRKVIMFLIVGFLIFGWSSTSFAIDKNNIYIVPSFQDSFTTIKPEIWIKKMHFDSLGSPILGDGLSKIRMAGDYSSTNLILDMYKVGSNTMCQQLMFFPTSQTTPPCDACACPGFKSSLIFDYRITVDGDTVRGIDGKAIVDTTLRVYWSIDPADSLPPLPVRSGTSDHPYYGLLFDMNSFPVRYYNLTPRNTALSGGEISISKSPEAPNGCSNLTPVFTGEFDLFKMVDETTYVYYKDFTFSDTNSLAPLRVILNPGILNPGADTLYNGRRTPKLLPGLTGGLQRIHPDTTKMKLAISWTGTSPYPPLDTNKAYNCRISGGVWDWKGLKVVNPPNADTFLADGTSPEMGIQDLDFVSASPSFLLKAYDQLSKVNSDSLFIDLYAVDLYGVILPDSTDTTENRKYIDQLTPDRIGIIDTSSGCAVVHTGADLEDGQALDVWTFNGRPFGVGGYENYRTPYPNNLGPFDYVWNQTVPLFKRFYVDGMPPNVRLSPNSTHQTLIFEISDTSSGFQVDTSGGLNDTTILCAGINSASIKLYENFQLVSPDSTKYNSSTGVYSVYYNPSSENVWLKLDVADKVGNMGSYQNYYEDDQLTLVEPHNYPNPFSPVSPIVDHRRTTIDPGVTKISGVEVVIDIYDLAGRHVASVKPVRTEGGKIVGYWDGKTDDGTLVANGVYLCCIQVRDTAQNKTLTQVIKIAVAKNDKRIF